MKKNEKERKEREREEKEKGEERGTIPVQCAWI